MPRGPKSNIEKDGKLSLIWADRRSGMTYRELSLKHGYPEGTLRRVLNKVERNAGDEIELAKIDASSPGLAEAVTIDRALATKETLARLDEAYRHYREAVDAGTKRRP